MKQIHFYALKQDLLSVLEMAESVAALKYVLMGNFPWQELSDVKTVFQRGSEISGLGTANVSSSIACDTYLVCPKNVSIESRELIGFDGLERICVVNKKGVGSRLSRLLGFGLAAGIWGEEQENKSVGQDGESRLILNDSRPLFIFCLPKMSRPRRCLLAFSVIGFLTVGVFVFLLCSRPSELKPKSNNFELIKPGMSQKEIICIIGLPNTAKIHSRVITDLIGKETNAGQHKYSKLWEDDGLILFVSFDSDENAIFVHRSNVGFADEPTLLDKLWRWLGL